MIAPQKGRKSPCPHITINQILNPLNDPWNKYALPVVIDVTARCLTTCADMYHRNRLLCFLSINFALMCPFEYTGSSAFDAIGAG